MVKRSKKGKMLVWVLVKDQKRYRIFEFSCVEILTGFYCIESCNSPTLRACKTQPPHPQKPHPLQKVFPHPLGHLYMQLLPLYTKFHLWIFPCLWNSPLFPKSDKVYKRWNCGCDLLMDNSFPLICISKYISWIPSHPYPHPYFFPQYLSQPPYFSSNIFPS